MTRTQPLLLRASAVATTNSHRFLSPRLTSTAAALSSDDLPPLFLQRHEHPPGKPPFFFTQATKEYLFSLIKSCSLHSHLLQLQAFLTRTQFINHRALSLHFLYKAIEFFPFELNYLCGVFSQFSDPTTYQYNAMIRAFHSSDFPHKGLVFYRQMVQNGVCTDSVSSMFVVKCCARVCALIEGKQVHCRVLVSGYQMDALLMTSLMEFYSACGHSGDACQVFDEMPQRDVVVWNVLISCLMQNRRTRDALAVFDAMRSEQYHCEPDDVTCLLLLQGCANLGALEFGKRLHGFVKDQEYVGSVKINNALVTMYSKCGCVDEAREVFKRMKKKSIVSWGAMMSGLAMNGCGRDAIEAFSKMQKMGFTPDDQSFTGLLSACSHSGLVDEGMTYFDRMTKEFGILPNIHHFGCVVDLLGRAGLLSQAYGVITSMRVKPDAKIWRTLLGHCRRYRDFALAEQVIEHLVELKAQEAGDYVLLLNIYSSVGNWEKMSELKRYMKENEVQTLPGCSTIEVKGVLHEFVADDASHPRKDEIYEMLSEIEQQLKIAGFVPELSSELHDLAVEEKKTSLSYHSEKLAIAFGILATPPGTTIRVAKNLQICVDCHNFATVLSAVYNRKVIIRDHNRFHHFVEGKCSCNDNW